MTGVVQEEECHLFQPGICTFEGIRKRFIKHTGEASRANNTSEIENEELLIFFFSGHGIFNDCNEFLGLVPVDYDGTEKLCITREVLLEWLQSCGCTASVLFIIDACYSGGFHKSSSSDFIDLKDSNARKGYVMYSCTEKQESFESSIVQHSTFSYCFSLAITANTAKKCFSTGLPIKDIEETYIYLTYAVCLLLETEQQHPGSTKFLMATITPLDQAITGSSVFGLD